MADDSERDLVIDVLDRLGARNRLVPGARLGFELAKTAPGFRATLKSRGLSLLDYLHLIKAEHGLKIAEKAGTDFLVGFETATVAASPPAETVELRRDVFEAFSRFGGGFSYDTLTDRFAEESGPGRIPVDPISLETALRCRREFAESLDGEARVDLLSTLDQGMASLRQFSFSLRRLGLTARWRAYFSAQLKAIIVDWAAQNGITVNQSWFEGSPRQVTRTVLGRRSVVNALEELPEEDWAKVLVPLSVVEKMLSRPVR